MKPWLIFGAGHGVGAHLLDLANQHANAALNPRPVTLLIRNPQHAEALRNQGLTVVCGDACDPGCVLEACQLAGPEAAIISTLGSRSADYQGNRVIIDTAEKLGLKRMLLVTSIGCGDSWPTLSPAARAAFGQAVREKSLAESWLQTSTLIYTVIRPGGLLDKPATDKAIRLQTEAHGMVTREDVARHLSQMIEDPATYHQIYALIEPGLAR
ncbi:MULTISPECIES: SDR family oxidoreductase [Yersinia]|uniref:SDR family oxidoreductase n=1 Tax=Yersinia TaxID=629 RepID=UPI0005E48792|nr:MULTISPECIES: SDR family oxidoreductase [Yersinia]RXA94325.1 SDR family oxidoreductase [Yersinia sp. 2105 StPb PI]CNI64331.1 flavin reductase [Yersinia frederiksenii]CNK65615.1 flavin reductase [Yersinia frederiksenii]